ncbi:MAG: hypothetical protein FK734_21240 [Asgard group archaeon]|nr:hypothetical protein [Asgard group archaeon]
MDKYLDDNRIEITFRDGLTRMHIDELMFFYNIELPEYLMLFYEQTNGLSIESEYFLDDLDDPSHFLINSCNDLSFSKKELNKLPDNRFLRFAENEDTSLYLLDLHNLTPLGNPLILLNMPIYRFIIPLTDNFEVLLESACIGLLGLIEEFGASEGKRIPPIPHRMLKFKPQIMQCLKEFFKVASREYKLLDVWHIDPKTKDQIQKNITDWFKGLKLLIDELK